MDKENQTSIARKLNLRDVIIILVIAFVLVVAYKFISSNIDEKRQGSILQQQSNISSQAKEPLNQCLNNVEIVLQRKSASARSLAASLNEPENVAICEDENIKRTGSKGNCITTLDEVNVAIQQYTNQAELDKRECYKQYDYEK